MYLTEMIKVLPTQSGRSLAPTAALSHVLKRQQHRPKIQHWLQEKKHSKASQESLAEFSKGAQPPFFPQEPRTRVRVPKRAGHSGIDQDSRCTVTWGSWACRVAPRQDVLPAAQTSLAEVLAFPKSTLLMAKQKCFSYLLPIPQGPGMLTLSWPHETEISPLRGLSRLPGPFGAGGNCSNCIYS